MKLSRSTRALRGYSRLDVKEALTTVQSASGFTTVELDPATSSASSSLIPETLRAPLPSARRPSKSIPTMSRPARIYGSRYESKNLLTTLVSWVTKGAAWAMIGETESQKGGEGRVLPTRNRLPRPWRNICQAELYLSEAKWRAMDGKHPFARSSHESDPFGLVLRIAGDRFRSAKGARKR